MTKILSPENIIESGLCIGCGICVAQFSRFGTKVRMGMDKYGQLKPQGPKAFMEEYSEIVEKACPFSPKALNEDELSSGLFSGIPHKNQSIGRFISNWIGYVREDEYRMQGSSGGMTSWIAKELIRDGYLDGVAHVVPGMKPDQRFEYRISRDELEIREGAKSRYYPVELSKILREIIQVPGKYAVIGVPCMIKAIQLLRYHHEIYRDRIRFTLSLFCGHLKSTRFIESFAWQMNVPFSEVKEIEFRHKIPDRPANWYCAQLISKNGRQVKKDWWHLADGDWGAGFFMNSACNFCDDVVGECADVSLGDAWIEPWISDGKGTNVVIVRSEMIQNLILKGIDQDRLDLKPTTDQIVEQTQAAGFRQRREGLAYRLLWAAPGLQPRKRVVPGAFKITPKRKLIYWIRYMISKWSHRFFWLASKMNKPDLYLSWARIISAYYYSLAYRNGQYHQIKKRLKSFRD